MTLGSYVRVLGISTAVVLSLASAKRPNSSHNYAGNYAGDSSQPPPARSMAPSAAVGLWKSTFGPVKIELDDKQGPGQVRGIWYYKRGAEEVIGDFGGQLRGNVLRFKWREPAKPASLTGQGYLVFDQRGQRFHGKWWTDSKDRTGTWTGWRQNQNNRPPPNNNGYDRQPPDNNNPPPPPPNDDDDSRTSPPPPPPPAGNDPYSRGTSMPPM